MLQNNWFFFISVWWNTQLQNWETRILYCLLQNVEDNSAKVADAECAEQLFSRMIWSAAQSAVQYSDDSLFSNLMTRVSIPRWLRTFLCPMISFITKSQGRLLIPKSIKPGSHTASTFTKSQEELKRKLSTLLVNLFLRYVIPHNWFIKRLS